MFTYARGNRKTEVAKVLRRYNPAGKVVFVGDGACGKTCLLEVYRCGEFPSLYVPTVVDNYCKALPVSDAEQINVSLWDTAGQEDYDALRPLSYSGADLVVLCYSLSDKRILENIENQWVAEIRAYSPKVPIVLLGLKKDLRDETHKEDRESLFIETEEGQRMADKIGALFYMECSSLTGENVSETFSKIGDIMYDLCTKKKVLASKRWCIC